MIRQKTLVLEHKSPQAVMLSAVFVGQLEIVGAHKTFVTCLRLEGIDINVPSSSPHKVKFVLFQHQILRSHVWVVIIKDKRQSKRLGQHND